MSNALLFFLSETDQARITAGSIQVIDEFLDNTHALKISFTIADPQNGAPEIRLLWPGPMDFRADPAYPGTLPAAQTFDLTTSAYSSWPTVGTLRVKAHHKDIEDITQLSGTLEVVPNSVWYFPVRLSQPFLFSTLGILSFHLMDFYVNKFGMTAGEYAADRVWWFLKGEYHPVVEADQRIAHPMPTVEMTSTGAVTLYLVTAQIRELQDGPRADLNGIAGNLPESDPSHPVNGSIPPRRVLQRFSAAMDGVRGANNALLPLAQKVLETPPGSAPLVPIRFRRTWKKLPNNSRYFPTQEVMINDAQTDELLLRSRIPHHGVVYFKSPPGSAGASLHVRIKILGGMRCLKGDDDTQPLWREKATSDELTYNFSAAGPFPEVILRRPMAEEIFTEPAFKALGPACTYHSMRRTIRALANNRIAGGQLNYVSLQEEKSRRQRSLSLLEQALGGAAARIKGDMPRQVTEGATRNAIEADITSLAASLKPVWVAFFPNGGKAYSLWQSAAVDWYEDDDMTLKPEYSDVENFRGRGAPGALVYLGLAATLHNDPRPFRDPAHSTESVDDYAKEITQTILTGLKPGAVLQFWKNYKGFEILKERRGTAAERAAIDSGKRSIYFVGHSPIFEKYFSPGDTKGIYVRDQSGPDGRRVSLQPNGRLPWSGYAPDIWIAANWDE